MNAALKRAGLGGVLVSPGLRSIASTALNEQGFPPDVIEAAQTHVDKNEVAEPITAAIILSSDGQ